MKHALLLGLLGAAQVYLGLQAGWIGALWIWSGLSFLVVAAGYGGIGPGVFGKRPDGSLPRSRVLVLAPFFLFSWALWHAERLLSREHAHDEIVPGLWIGRRPLERDLPAGARLIIDMTAEFPIARGVCDDRDYVCVPTLDAAVPRLEALIGALDRVSAAQGGIFIHCASGHGRSAMMAAAALLALGHAETAEQAEQMVKAARPGISLKPAQRRALTAIVKHPADGC